VLALGENRGESVDAPRVLTGGSDIRIVWRRSAKHVRAGWNPSTRSVYAFATCAYDE
jgi:hypothetical protein